MPETEHPTPAPCRTARCILIIMAAVSLLAGALPAADLLLRSRDQDRPAAQWMAALHLFAPALDAAGTSRRHPETLHPAVDLRFMAGIGEWP